MFRRIVATLLMIEGGMFLAAGMTPGMQEMVQTVFSQHPDLLPPEKLGEVIGVFAILQRIAMAFGLLCFAGGWGAQQKRKWGRWVALVASTLNLPMLPFLTPLGIAGLIAFFKSEEQQREGEAAVAGSRDRPEPVSHVLVMLASLALVVNFSYLIRGFAAQQGLPVDPNSRLALGWILAGQLLFTLVHELGHLLAAWGVGFQFREINVGPFTLRERPDGSWSARFEWNRILAAGGYLQAVPRTTKDLKLNWILVVIAGPSASLFLALLGFLTLISLPGTVYAPFWEWAAFVTSICLADCIANLLPLGMTDGALLVHSVLGTKRGKSLLAQLEAAMLNDKVDREAGQMDPAEVQEARRKALEQLESSKDASGLALAAQRIEFARAALGNGSAEEAAAALTEAGRTLEGLSEAPPLIWFRYWSEVFGAATARHQYAYAADAREKALEFGEKLSAQKMDWEERAAIDIERARMWMSDADFYPAVATLQATRESCPGRRTVSLEAVELLGLELECELRMGRPDPAEELAAKAVRIAGALGGPQQVSAMESLAGAAARLSNAGDWEFANRLFGISIEGLENSTTAPVSARFRTAWAASLYEHGKLEEAASVLAPIQASGMRFTIDVETLRAQLLLAEDRPQDALELLTPLVVEETPSSGTHQIAVERSRALRSWALYRSGELEEAVSDARRACDILMPAEHPDAAPALLTLAMVVAQENANLSEAYLQEGTRLICDSKDFSAVTKASRLTDLARSVVQVSRKDWAKLLLDQAAKLRTEQRRFSTSAAGR